MTSVAISGGIAPPTTFIYTTSSFPASHKLLPLLLDRLGTRNSGSRNRLITPEPLFELAGLKAPHETGEPHHPTNAPRDQGSNDAEKS